MLTKKHTLPIINHIKDLNGCCGTSIGGYCEFENLAELKEALKTYTESATRSKYGEIKDWKVGKVTDFSELFLGFRTQKNPDSGDVISPDISKWDVSNATKMASMFEDSDNFDPAVVFATAPDISKWKVDSFHG